VKLTCGFRRGADKPTKVAAIALANKIARMVWAMMVKGERYKEPVALAR
jgi:transposase